jgi:ceramide glucosyltransferase
MDALAVFAAAVLIAVVCHYWLLERAVMPPPPTRPRPFSYPSLTVIRPIRGVDVDAETNLTALLDAEYPGDLEILFVLDDRTDPAWPVVSAAVARHPTSARVEVLTAGAPPPGRTGKLNAMILGVARARGELVAFSDSDTRPGRDLLRILVETLLAIPSAGDAFAPVVVSDPAQRAGDVGYALLQNAWYAPAVARASRPIGDLPFIMGQIMVFRREALEAIGGLACAEGQLVDDMYIGTCVARAGYRNIMVGKQLPISTGGMSFAEFIHVFRRWLLFSRNGLPLGFTLPHWLRGIEFWGALVLMVLALDRGDWPAIVLAALALAISVISQVWLNRRFGGAQIALRYLWVPLALPLVGPLVTLTALLYHHVDWRGRDYSLGTQAKLDDERSQRPQAMSH